MSSRLKLNSNGGGSVSLKVDDTLTTDEEVEIDATGNSGIESGSNANGEYTKFPDGTLICHIKDVSIVRESDYTMRYFWTFPVPFISIPTTVGSLTDVTPDTLRDLGTDLVYNDSGSLCEYRILFNANCPAGAAGIGSIQAIGRWK